MAQPKGDKAEQNSHSDVVTTRVNVAFPFSRIRVQEPSADLVELVAIVNELADLVAEVAPGETARALVERAEALATRLK